MPTSAQEAETITKIMNTYLTPEEAKEIVKELNTVVGDKTDNMSLKVSLQMLHALYNPPKPPKSKKMKAAFYAVVAFHMVVLFGNCAAMVVLPLLAPWYISLPIMSLMVNFLWSPIACPLTKLESRIRTHLDMPEIRFFIKHYFIEPIRNRRKK